MSVPPVDRLLYGQNWEDPELEVTALNIAPTDRVVAVAGAGCTALTLLARGPRSLYAVDRSAAQLHLLRLKLAAVCHLPPGAAAGFLGGVDAADRPDSFEYLAPHLHEDTVRYWRQRREQIARGAISQGRVERYFSVIRRLLRVTHSRRRVDELFEQPTLEAQRSFYRRHWDTLGWRALFLLAHKRILNRVLDPSFYQYVDGQGFANRLRGRAARCIMELPIQSNYFLSWMLRGRYCDEEVGRPAYLGSGAASMLQHGENRIKFHHGDIRDFLRTMPDSSGDKFYLSNVSEWLPENELAPFFEEVGRVAREGATVCYRALMADRCLPAAVVPLFEEHRDHSAALAARDRAFINVAFHIMTVRKGRHADAHG